jgi:hypothetical protein
MYVEAEKIRSTFLLQYSQIQACTGNFYSAALGKFASFRHGILYCTAYTVLRTVAFSYKIIITIDSSDHS